MVANRIYFLHCLTPTHVGTGRGIGYIDLPVYREKITNWPAAPASGFKGVWADHFGATAANRRATEQLRLAFGVADDLAGSGSNAGALIPTDARLVCLPVRSFGGTFAWCTSHLALRMLHRDLQFAGIPNAPAHVPDSVKEEEVLLCTNSTLRLTGVPAGQPDVFLEDLDCKAVVGQPLVQEWAEKIAGWVFPTDWQTEFKSRFAILPDVVFDYLTETGTEVVTRVRIDDDTKTVAEGQLWTEESLPAEAILAGVVSCDRVYNGNKGNITAATLLDAYARDPLTLQIGGKASVGRGKVRCTFTSGGDRPC